MPSTAFPRRVLARRATAAAAVCAVFVLLSALRVHAQHSAALLTVRLYNRFGLPPRDLDTARDTATSLLENAGISVHWRECESSSMPGDSCSDVLAPYEISIRVVAAPPAFASGDVLGYSYVDAASRRGTLATVFPDRVIAIAPELRMAPATLLGRAMAHEVGHLLLGSNAHAAAGLMRAHWSVEPRHRATDVDWQFSRDEAAHMQAALDARVSQEGVVAAVTATH